MMKMKKKTIDKQIIGTKIKFPTLAKKILSLHLLFIINFQRKKNDLAQ